MLLYQTFQPTKLLSSYAFNVLKLLKIHKKLNVRHQYEFIANNQHNKCILNSLEELDRQLFFQFDIENLLFFKSFLNNNKNNT